MRLKFGFRDLNTRVLIKKKSRELYGSMLSVGLQWMNHPIPLVCSAEDLEFDSLTSDILEAPAHEIVFTERTLSRGTIDAPGGQHRDDAVQMLHQKTFDLDIQKAVVAATKAKNNLALRKQWKTIAEDSRVKKEKNSWWIGAVYEECTWRFVTLLRHLTSSLVPQHLSTTTLDPIWLLTRLSRIIMRPKKKR